MATKHTLIEFLDLLAGPSPPLLFLIFLMLSLVDTILNQFSRSVGCPTKHFCSRLAFLLLDSYLLFIFHLFSPFFTHQHLGCLMLFSSLFFLLLCWCWIPFVRNTFLMFLLNWSRKMSKRSHGKVKNLKNPSWCNDLENVEFLIDIRLKAQVFTFYLSFTLMIILANWKCDCKRSFYRAPVT